MTLTTLRERKEKAEERITKKEALIVRKNALIEKKETALEKLTDEHDRYWSLCEINELKSDIERLTKEIAELKKKVASYEDQISGAVEIEKTYEREIPEAFKTLKADLENNWNAYDIEKRDRMCNEYRNGDYNEFVKKYNPTERDFMWKTDDQIRKENERAAKNLVLDLYNRVKHITGEVTDWSDIRAEVGTHGFTVLNGIVIGKEGRAEVESILAGGYNIQRLHVRVLVKEIQ